MLPPTLRQGSGPKGLYISRQLVSTLRASRNVYSPVIVLSISGGIQARAYCGRRRYDSHDDYKRKFLEKRWIYAELEAHHAKQEPEGVGKMASEKSMSDVNTAEPASTQEPSLREKIWKQRMDHIRRTIDDDPYEALFGQSNRLLGRFGRRDWPFELPNWWRKDLEVFKAPSFKKYIVSWNSWSGDPQSAAQAAKQAFERTGMENTKTPAAGNATANSAKSVSSMEEGESELEYDPISNRMVHKSDKSFSHYGQDLDAAVEIPVKQYKLPFESNGHPVSPLPKTISSEETPHEHPVSQFQVKEPAETKPPLLSQEPSSPERSSNRPPTFTMLKEEPSESQPSPTVSEAASERSGGNISGDVRAEYDQFKANRLPFTLVACDGWLVKEGFLSTTSGKPLGQKMSASGDLPAQAPEKRIKLEENFEQVHSVDRELALDRMIENKPWKAQRSKGTEMPVKVHEEDQKGTFQALLDHRDNINPQVKEAITLVTGKGDANEEVKINTPEVKLAVETETTKTETAAARKEILNYHIQVAKDNMKNCETDARKEVANHRAQVAESIERAKAEKDVLDYQKQVAIDNLKNQMGNAQKEGMDSRARIAEAIEEARAHAEILDYNFSVMGNNLRASHGRKLQQAKEKVQDLIRELEDSRAAEYRAQSGVHITAEKTQYPGPMPESQRRELKPKVWNSTCANLRAQEALKEAQKAGGALAKVAAKNAELDRSMKREWREAGMVEPVWKSTWPEEKRRQLEEQRKQELDRTKEVDGVLMKEDEELQHRSRVPSLAEFYGYTPKKSDASAAIATPEDSKLKEAQSSILEDEIKEQKAAMQALGQPRSPVVTETSHTKQDSAWPASEHDELKNEAKDEVKEQQTDKDESLIREIRGIYETKYGKITTNHTQPPSISTSASPSVETTEDSIATVITLVDAPAAELVTEIAEPQTEPFETTPSEAQAVPYTLLAYDPQTQTITRATFTSPPQSSESVIPLTLALRHLHSPAKFLPLVQDLRNKGYEPIHGEKNMLILRQMQVTENGKGESRKENFEVETMGVKDEPGPSQRLPSWGAVIGPRRTEMVFSGAQSQKAPKTKKERKERKRAWRRGIRRLALGVATVGGTIYVAGVMAEMTKVVVG